MKQNLVFPALMLVLGIGIGLTVGYTAGKPDVEGDSADMPSSTMPVGPRRAGAEGRHLRGFPRSVGHGRPDGSPAVAIRRLCDQLDQSPAIYTDYEALFGIYQDIRWMGPEDIRHALAELDSRQDMKQSTTTLRLMLLGLWSKFDGEGPIQYALGMNGAWQRNTAVLSGMRYWMRSDPSEAYRWYREHGDELQEELQLGAQVEAMFVAALAHEDLNAALTEIDGLSGPDRKAAFSMIARKVAADEAKREQLIAHLDKVEDQSFRQSGISDVIANWGSGEPRAALSYLER
ncbi:MAG: hypothetical protein R3242_09845, partial [Akkermansiaceae bacterium]|nr:hypothetical protein [Akkermansiaceae bacterium]